MEQQAINNLEQIENPILALLLIVLIVAHIFQYRERTKLQERLYIIATESVGAIKDVTTRLEDIEEKLNS
jgi:hypothetical protein